MIQLAAAADFFGLSLLQKRVLDLSRGEMEEKADLACSFFDEAVATRDANNAELALSVIRSKTSDTLLPPSNIIMFLRPAALSNSLYFVYCRGGPMRKK
jgi:hypothetical protein